MTKRTTKPKAKRVTAVDTAKADNERHAAISQHLREQMLDYARLHPETATAAELRVQLNFNVLELRALLGLLVAKKIIKPCELTPYLVRVKEDDSKLYSSLLTPRQQ